MLWLDAGDWKIATGVVVGVAVAIGAGGGAKAYHSYRKKERLVQTKLKDCIVILASVF